MTAVMRLARGVRRVLVGIAALGVLATLVVGIPWGLVHFIGWPLPTHVPTADDVHAVLLAPLSVSLLLNLLACIAWPVWLVFVIDVVRCLAEALHGVPRPTKLAGPLRMVAASLVGALALSLLSPKTTPTPPSTTTQGIADTLVGVVAISSVTEIHLSSLRTTPQAQPPTPPPNTVVVQEPRHGIHDSLWRIAARELGDGRRWPEIWDLNKGKTMTDGQAFTDPNLIQPEWLLTKPVAPTVPVSTPGPTSNAQDEDGGAPTPTPSLPAPAPPTPAVKPPAATVQPQPTVTSTSDSGALLTTRGFVSLGLAGAVATALTIQRLRRRRRHRPGSTDHDYEPPMAPVVRSLRIVHDHIPDADDLCITTVDGPSTPAPSTLVTSLPPATAVPVPVGVRDGRTHAIELAQLRGLGLTGAGAEAAARALVVHLLATTSSTVILPAADAVALLGTNPVSSSPRLQIVDHIDAAVAVLSREVRERMHIRDHTGFVMVAAVDTPPNPRLQAVLDNGGTVNIAGILLGHWPAGGTVRVRSDGIVGAASPGLTDALLGSRLFHLDTNDTRALVELLTEAAPDLPCPRAEHDALPPRLHQNDHPTAPNETPQTPEPTAANPVGTAEAATTDAGPRTVRSGDATQVPGALSILGPCALSWQPDDSGPQDLTTVLARKHRLLLIFLALHPEGATRDALREALWPTARGSKPLNAFYATLSQIRSKLTDVADDKAAEIIELRGDRVVLRPDLIAVDYWELLDAEHALHIATDDTARHAALSRIAATYRGELAEGISELWLDGPREAAHRSAVNALAALAATYRKTDPPRRLQILEHARLLDQYNEDIYRDIMRTQAELGLTDSISRTLALLTTALAEIGDQPEASTVTLAHALQQHYRQMTPG